MLNADQRMRQPSTDAGDGDEGTGATSLAAVARIRDVINTAVVPSWLKKNSIPGTFGSASAGTLKANEWRVLLTLYIPIALISVWVSGVSPEVCTPNALRTLGQSPISEPRASSRTSRSDG